MCLYCEAEKALKAQKAKTTTTKAGSNIRRITPAPTPTRIRIKSEQERSNETIQWFNAQGQKRINEKYRKLAELAAYVRGSAI